MSTVARKALGVIDQPYQDYSEEGTWASVAFTTLQTIIVEIEAIFNDRPLAHVSSDVIDEELLTPAHLQYGRRITALPDIRVELDEILDPDYNQNGNAEIQKKYKHLALFLQHFWIHWRQEYLTSPREFYKATGNNNAAAKVGDVVLLHDVERMNARFRLRTSHDPNRMLMKENKAFFLFAFNVNLTEIEWIGQGETTKSTTQHGRYKSTRFNERRGL